MKTGKIPSVLVTGGEGFLGSHAARFLAGLGCELTVLTRRPVPPAHAAPGRSVRYVFGDITQPISLPDRFDFVLHLAGRCETALRTYPAEDYFRTNAAGTENLLRSLRFRHFIMISSIKIYRERPSPYADSLRAAESACALSGAECIVLRCGNIYGPGQAENSVVPVFLARAARHQDLILTEGARKSLRPLHVLDFLDAIRRVISRPVPGIYDLVGPERVNLLRLAREVKQIACSDSRIVLGPRRPEAHDAVHSRKFSATFGWAARRALIPSLRELYRDCADRGQ